MTWYELVSPACIISKKLTLCMCSTHLNKSSMRDASTFSLDFAICLPSGGKFKMSATDQEQVNLVSSCQYVTICISWLSYRRHKKFCPLFFWLNCCHYYSDFIPSIESTHLSKSIDDFLTDIPLIEKTTQSIIQYTWITMMSSSISSYFFHMHELMSSP